MRLLFVSRAFPPTIGGIEQQNAALAAWFEKSTELTLIANRRGKKWLPLFLPWAFLQMLWHIRRQDVVLLGDGVLAPLGALAALIAPHTPIVSIVHGLDITFATKKSWFARLYAHCNLPALRLLDGIICVSEATREVALSVGLIKERTVVIPNGVDPDQLRVPRDRTALEKLLGMTLEGRIVVLRIGRFVKHKGTEWFLREVMPHLPENVILVAAGGMVSNQTPGDGNIFPLCVAAVHEFKLEERVRLLPNVPWDVIRLLLSSCDIAVAPNIRVPGSMEGFGISVIEAGSCGLPSVVARLEGLQEAVCDGENGHFVDSGDAHGFIRVIQDWVVHPEARVAFGERAAHYVREHFDWQHIHERYLAAFEEWRERTSPKT